MLRRVVCLLLVLLCAFGAAGAEGLAEVSDAEAFGPAGEAVFPPETYEFEKRVSVRYVSDTLCYTIESFTLDSIPVLLTKIWVADPLRQIRKVNAPWGKSLAQPLALAKQIPETVLATNASGYITKAYPDLPEGYPGTSKDYYFTTLGSVVVTDGRVLRTLDGVPFYGLALTGDGITLYRGAENADVLAESPQQTWAFFETCAMQVNGEDTLPEEGTWPMAREQHSRSVLARVNRNNYLMLHVPNREDSYGLSLYRINRFFSAHFATEWVYNLDGGYSSALIYRKQEKNARLVRLAPNRQPVADIMCFTE